MRCWFSSAQPTSKGGWSKLDIPIQRSLKQINQELFEDYQHMQSENSMRTSLSQESMKSTITADLAGTVRQSVDTNNQSWAADLAAQNRHWKGIIVLSCGQLVGHNRKTCKSLKKNKCVIVTNKNEESTFFQESHFAGWTTSCGQSFHPWPLRSIVVECSRFRRLPDRCRPRKAIVARVVLGNKRIGILKR